MVTSRYTVSGSGMCPQRVLLPRGKIACRTVCHVSPDKIGRWSRCRASARFAYERHDADRREVVRKHLRALIGKVNHCVTVVSRRGSLLCCVPLSCHSTLCGTGINARLSLLQQCHWLGCAAQDYQRHCMHSATLDAYRQCTHSS